MKFTAMNVIGKTSNPKSKNFNQSPKPNNMVFTFSIDLTKIDKTRIKEVQKKDGTMGKFINLVMMTNEQPDQYGNDGFIAESVTKDEKEAGKRGNILGNCKQLGKTQFIQPAPAPTQNTANANVVDDLPF